MDVTTEKDLNARSHQEVPDAVSVWWIDREVPIVPLVATGEVPVGFPRGFHERPVMHHRHVMVGRRQVRKTFQ